MIKCCTLIALTLNWLRTLGPETFVFSCKMIIRQPPVKMLVKLRGVVSGCPGAAGKLGDGLADGQVGAFDEGSIDVAGKSSGDEAGTIIVE